MSSILSEFKLPQVLCDVQLSDLLTERNVAFAGGAAVSTIGAWWIWYVNIY